MKSYAKVTLHAKNNAGRSEIIQFVLWKYTPYFTFRVTTFEAENYINTLLEKRALKRFGKIDFQTISRKDALDLFNFGWESKEITNITRATNKAQK